MDSEAELQGELCRSPTVGEAVSAGQWASEVTLTLWIADENDRGDYSCELP